MDELTLLANKYASDKGTVAPIEGHHGPRLNFTTVYSKYFEPIRNENIKILEIGVGSGPSLKIWYDYFPNAKIHAIDIGNQSNHNNDRVVTYTGDQSSREDLLKIMEEIGEVDLIIDDGSHVISHQQISLGFLFKYLKKGGQYWVEDLHTSDGEVWQGKSLYGYDMSFKDGESTVQIIEQFIESKKFNSPFLSDEENNYLTNNIKNVEVFDLPKTFYGINKLALFQK